MTAPSYTEDLTDIATGDESTVGMSFPAARTMPRCSCV